MSHTYANILVHVIFATKDRQSFLNDDIRPRLHDYLGGIINGEIGQAVCIGGTADHVHALLKVKTDECLAHAMNRLKSLSSGWVKKTFVQAMDFAWQPGYGAFSVSESNADRVRQYIHDRLDHHRRCTFAEEFAEFLRKNHMVWDPYEGVRQEDQSPLRGSEEQ